MVLVMMNENKLYQQLEPIEEKNLFDLHHQNEVLRDDQQDIYKVQHSMIKQDQMQASLELQVRKNVLLDEQHQVELKDSD
jgi:hypothetical protein